MNGNFSIYYTTKGIENMIICVESTQLKEIKAVCVLWSITDILPIHTNDCSAILYNTCYNFLLSSYNAKLMPGIIENIIFGIYILILKPTDWESFSFYKTVQHTNLNCPSLTSFGLLQPSGIC